MLTAVAQKLERFHHLILDREARLFALGVGETA
jgi:hypothetical protein